MLLFAIFFDKNISHGTIYRCVNEILRNVDKHAYVAR